MIIHLCIQMMQGNIEIHILKYKTALIIRIISILYLSLNPARTHQLLFLSVQILNLVLLLYGFYAHVYTPIWDLQYCIYSYIGSTSILPTTYEWIKRLMAKTPWQSEGFIIKVSYLEAFLLMFKWSNKS